KAALACVSGRSKVVPSTDTNRRPRNHAPVVAGSATGRQTLANNAFIGSAPGRNRARPIAPLVGTRHV
ncbi:hypothetical protein, partial [Streptomyces sp. Wh19]|uniref:hypothetical protein n=1 Tax=Streptomyces sp. Wh19 TaxID=3076629 RepID=UPI003FA35393